MPLTFTFASYLNNTLNNLGAPNNVVRDENKSIHQREVPFFPTEKQILLEQTQLSYADVYIREASLQTKLSRQTLFYFKQSRLDLFTRSAQELSVKAEDFYAEC